MKITKAEAIKKIKEQHGRIFSVEFVKKNGDLRKMNAKLFVKKGINGNGRKGWSDDPLKDYGIISAFDVQANGYRSINVDTLRKLREGKNEYIIEGDDN